MGVMEMTAPRSPSPRWSRILDMGLESGGLPPDDDDTSEMRYRQLPRTLSNSSPDERPRTMSNSSLGELPKDYVGL